MVWDKYKKALVVKSLLAGIQVLVFLVLLASQAAAQTLSLSTIKYPPLVLDKDQGVVLEIAEEVMGRVGLNVNFRIYPWARSLSMAVKGRSDGILPIFKTPERAQKLQFHDVPLFTIDMILFRKAQQDDIFDGEVASIIGKKIAFITATNLTPAFDSAKKDGRIQPIFANSIEQQMRMLNAERVDFIVAERYAGLQSLAKLKLDSVIQQSKVPVVSNPVFIGLYPNENARRISKQIDLAITKMKTDGTYEKLVNSHLINPSN